ncbi:hypothetical protein OE88DRAFT_1807115 [Heliocybe sulcata]|uniref:Uncharacterized protein n=1 Tax=Heliocybe sulcata TaxID=5364 RepID=A0A5C3NF47_9AGAM|nr:hypothetical protein OE88DRAFT_1807115 [Heliocybe sulcata]
MMAPTNGISSASKLMFRHWRDVRNRQHLGYAAGYQNRLSPYVSSTNNTLFQRQSASMAKALVCQDKHRIPKSNGPATIAAGLHGPSALLLRTLNQTRLDVEDFVDLAGRTRKTVRFPVAPEEPMDDMSYFTLRHKGGINRIPFPPDSHGFLYWYLEPDAPHLSGQVRFRTTTSSDPATFSSGRDLQLPDGGTWHISLFEIARGSKYSGLRAQLLSEELVSAKVLDTALNISALRGAKIHHPATGSLLIWLFGQKFLVDLRSIMVSVWTIGSSAAEQFYLRSLFSVKVRESGSAGIGKRVGYRPFTGRVLVQFERSTLPEHKGTCTVVLRIVKIIEVTKSDSSDDASWMPEPTEGSLVLYRGRGHQHWTPWSVDVDRPRPGSESAASSAKALTILFENEARQAPGTGGSANP